MRVSTEHDWPTVGCAGLTGGACDVNVLVGVLQDGISGPARNAFVARSAVYGWPADVAAPVFRPSSAKVGPLGCRTGVRSHVRMSASTAVGEGGPPPFSTAFSYCVSVHCGKGVVECVSAEW